MITQFLRHLCSSNLYVIAKNQVLVLVLETWVLVLVLVLESLGTCYITGYYHVADWLPDACLSEIARGVGNDWRRLANQLRLSVSDERRHRTGNTAELAVLRAWRDRHLEQPSEALNRLRRALSTLGRTDLLKILEFYVRDARRRSASVGEEPKLVSTV